jgi:hypothetical protein
VCVVHVCVVHVCAVRVYVCIACSVAQLSPEEFADGLRDMGIAAPAREINALVAYFDSDRRYVSSRGDKTTCSWLL